MSAKPPDRPTARGALRQVAANPALRRIEIAWALGIAGDAAYVVALVVAAFAEAGAVGVGILTIVRMAPSVVGAPLAGLLAGRRPPARLLLGAHAIRAGAAVLGTAALAMDAGALPVLGAATVSASAGAFVRPLQASAMPAMARDPDELIAANVAMSTGEGIGSFGGPLVAGLLLAVTGPTGAAAGASLLFVVAALSLATLRTTGDEAAEHAAERRARAMDPVSLGAVGRELTAGLRVAARQRGAATILGGFAGQVLVRGMLTTLSVVAAIRLLGMGEAGVGVLSAAYGLGTLAGALLAVRLTGDGGGGRALGPPYAVSLSLWGLPLAVVAAVPHPVVAIVALAVSGVANATLDVAGFTLLQRCVPGRDRVAIFGLLEAIVAVGLAAGSAGAAVAVDALGDRGALAVAGAILPILAVAIWGRLRQVDREVVVPERQLHLLRGISLFARLPMTALERLAEAMRPQTVAAGTAIMIEGEPGTAYVVIIDGEVEIRAGGAPVARCGPGEGVGEIALLRSVPRTASVVALTDARLEILGSADFLAAVAGPTSAAAAAAVIDERLARSGMT